MAGIIAASSGSNPFGNAMGGISQAVQAAKEKMQGVASGEGDLESRVAALEGQAGSAGGGEVAGVAGMNDAALSAARGMFGDIGMRQSSITRGIFR